MLSILLTLLACATSIGYMPNVLKEFVERMDLTAYDLRMKILPAVMDPRVVIVDIDDKSLTEVGRFPWSRDIVANLVDQLSGRYKVKAIGFDVMFAEPDTSSGYAILAALAKQELKDVPKIGEHIGALKSKLDFDGRLAKSFQNRPIVLGYFLTGEDKKGLLPPPAFTVASLDGRSLDARSVQGYVANLDQLQKAAKVGGFFNATDIDPDGVLRSTPIMMQVGDNYYESLALATARVAVGATKVDPIFVRDQYMSEQAQREYGALETINLNSTPQIKIPVERYLMTRIQFRGTGGPKGGAFRYVSAVDVIKGRVAMKDLEQRIVLIGTSAAGLNDLRATPVNPNYPGVEIHANIIASILDGNFKRIPDYSIAIDLLQVLLLGIVLTIALSALTPFSSILFVMGSAVVLGSFNFWMYQTHNSVLPVVTALMLIVSLFMFHMGWGYLFEHRKGRALVSRFGEYVAPELVAEMAENPESYNMDGESRELTILFADVRGFTTISEGLEPNALREYINLYLTAMSEDIRDSHHGTLDKYIGDCVMAFWGAPVAFPDHASRAVATALLMHASADKLDKAFIARGWPSLKIGIGLNTGLVRVGDMGSKIRRAYTVMGDAVNLSSRLEGITKVYGVGIVVGEATKLAAPEFAYRELDLVRVKGKTIPVAIFEPLGLATTLTEAQHSTLRQWHEAFEFFGAQDWNQAEHIIRALHQSNPDDGLYSLYLKRIAFYRENPPGPDWDGSTTFDTK